MDTGKLDPHAAEGHFVGYDEEAKGYWVYWCDKLSVIVEHDIYIDKDTILKPGDVMFEVEASTNHLGSNPDAPVSKCDETLNVPLKTIEMPTKNPEETPGPSETMSKCKLSLLHHKPIMIPLLVFSSLMMPALAMENANPPRMLC